MNGIVFLCTEDLGAPVNVFSCISILLFQKQLEEADKLDKQQSETATTHYKKFELIDKLYHDGAAQNLASRYNMKSFHFH